ncbi:MAG: histidinol-phosphatase HisJ family protein [Synergistaceae bacterium]|nr:histidinol-phosphatase HisJ family protein [Synergistaceae bacterium]
MKYDYHVHSEFSDDSTTPMELQAEQAVTLGLDELCFTDHVDYGVKYDAGDPMLKTGNYEANANYSEYFPALEAVREKFRGMLTIRAGLEFGVQTITIKQYEDLYAKYRGKLDFVLLSIHQIDNLELWTQQYQAGKSQAEYNRGYYEELLRVMQNFHDYSVLAHLDLVVRYDQKGMYLFANVKDIVAEILETAIRDGKGIELNTSSWRYGLSDTTPSREILELYRDLGGEILTMGSDAHSPKYLAAHFDEGRDILRSLGFRYICTFEGMKPKFHAL